MPVYNKTKGVILVVCGIAWVIFVYNFDVFMGKPRAFDTKALLCFAFGAIAVINGIRIYKRKR
jgi:hypothetical protein